MASCFHCKRPFDEGYRPGRGDACPKCGSDVKACLNCRFHDRGSYNECREGSAERVVDKEKANFCEHFELGGGPPARGEDPMERLKALFKG